MSLGAVEIAGLILGILGLWGLPTLWTRILYASQVPRQRAKLNARITRRLHDLDDKISGSLRSVDGLQAQVEDIKRRYQECYTEMTFAYSALQWPMWVVWCFRADPYLSRLVALDEELSPLLKQIEDRNDLGRIVATAVTTAEPDNTRTPLSTLFATTLSIIDFIMNFRVRRLYIQDQVDKGARPPNPMLPSTAKQDYSRYATTIWRPTSTELLAGGRSLPSAITVSSLPHYLGTENSEHSQSLHPIIIRRPSNSGDISGDPLSSRRNDLPVEPAHHRTTDGAEAPILQSNSSVTISANSHPTSSEKSAANNPSSSRSSGRWSTAETYLRSVGVRDDGAKGQETTSKRNGETETQSLGEMRWVRAKL